MNFVTVSVGSAKKSADVTELQIGVKVRLLRIIDRFYCFVVHLAKRVNLSLLKTANEYFSLIILLVCCVQLMSDDNQVVKIMKI